MLQEAKNKKDIAQYNLLKGLEIFCCCWISFCENMDSLKNLSLQENNGKALPEKRYLQIQKALRNSQDLSKRY